MDIEAEDYIIDWRARVDSGEMAYYVDSLPQVKQHDSFQSWSDTWQEYTSEPEESHPHQRWIFSR